MKIKKQKIKLDAFEQEIEDNLHKFKPIKNSRAFIKAVREAAREHVKKRKSVTIELSNGDIASIQAKASQLGVTYQAYISGLLHHVASDN